MQPRPDHKRTQEVNDAPIGCPSPAEDLLQAIHDQEVAVALQKYQEMIKARSGPLHDMFELIPKPTTRM